MKESMSNFTEEQNRSRDHIVDAVGTMDDLNIGRIEGFIAGLMAMKGVS